jgi:uncharacterized protein
MNDPKRPHGIGDKASYTWMPTFSNLELDFSDEEWIVLPIEDIAHALSNICRFSGHCKKFYSVAEHSVLISHLVPPELGLVGLMHDASEAYVGDMNAGLKRVIGGPFKDLERKACKAIATGYGIPIEQFDHPKIKEFDIKILGEEARHLMPYHPGWDQFPDRLDIVIHAWSPEHAKAEFLKRYTTWPGGHGHGGRWAGIVAGAARTLAFSGSSACRARSL